MQCQKGLGSEPRMRNIYYAHAMCMYGEPEEYQEIALIRRRLRGSRIVNPASYSGLPEKLRDGVKFCLRIVETCQVVVFSRLLGEVTAGVGKEVNHALKIGVPVFELKAGKLVSRTRPVEYMSRAATKRLYRKWRGFGPN